ncbi:hypothetical protein U9M48_001761 [Paspalum notatum var. saurae]|uniref:Reverse transcriptase zinc-binding domain-containing protein n=1 Tax=Paspalum notatum var. saurae TaxID=547442 RepID=A0AAQ3PF85_PASNO
MKMLYWSVSNNGSPREMNNSLLAPFSSDEVWAAVESIGDLKAPGPDGMPSIFYIRFWNLVGDKVKKEVLEVLNGGHMPQGWNDTSAFVPGSMITDNVLLAYELTHLINTRRKGLEGLAAVKLDMSKAYDRIEWSFLKKTMQKLGFQGRWIDLIMKCVMTGSYQIKVNVEYTDSFFPQRKDFQPCYKMLNLKAILKALKKYELASGQMINNDKSSVLFSPNTSNNARQQMRAILSSNQEAKNERYLGLPVSVGRSRRKAFELRHSSSRACRTCVYTRKEILVKAVAQAIPTYAMSCFDLTKVLCDELSSMIGRFWWSQQDKVNKIHWPAWEQLTKSKKNGGLDFWDLHLFNWQCWHDKLGDSNILECVAREGISYSWRSILQGVKLLKKGLIWRIGDGNDTHIWKDPWIPRGTTRRPSTPQGSSLLTRVSDLIDPVSGRWDVQLVRDTFCLDDAEVILTIPINEASEDWPAWHFDVKGIFSVKSAYKRAVQVRDQEMGRDASSSSQPSVTGNGSDFIWHKIWQLRYPNKINMFIWRLAHNSLPVKGNLARRGIKTDTLCPLCCRLDEDCGHLFLKCKLVKHSWRAMDLEHIRNELESCRSGKEAILRIMNLQKNEMDRIFIGLWRWWSPRNKVNAGGNMVSVAEINSSVSFYLMEFEKLATKGRDNVKAFAAKWEPPPIEIYKINVDASFHASSGQGGWGFVARDCGGVYLEGGAGIFLGLLMLYRLKPLEY